MQDNSFTGADGVRYHLSKLRAADVCDLRRWVQFAPYYDFATFKGSLPDEEYQRCSESLLSECARKNKVDVERETNDVIKTFGGSIHIIYLSLRRNHPGLTLNQVENIVTQDNIEDIVSQLNILSGVAGAVKKKDTEDLRPFDLGPMYRAGLRNGILPQDIDDMTIEQLSMLLEADDENGPDANDPLLIDDPDLARANARLLGFAVRD